MTAYTIVASDGITRMDLTAGEAGRLAAPLDATLFGWRRKPHGWCRGDACIPAFRARDVEYGDGVDLPGFAELLGMSVVPDTAARVVGVGAGAPDRDRLASGMAPDFTLRDLDGRSHTLSDHRGSKVALVMWASWCGCRYDLPSWQEQHAELSRHGFTVLSVALDRDPADAAPWIAEAAPTHPALIDTDGAVAELYDVINVPTVVWIDEAGRIARPQDTQTATDLFRSMNGLDSAAARAALRHWVRTADPGLSDDQVRAHLRVPTPEGQRSRVHARMAAWLWSQGEGDAARRHLDAAARLAPHDVAIRRGMMSTQGVDPFGAEYFALREELERSGTALYRPLPDRRPVPSTEPEEARDVCSST